MPPPQWVSNLILRGHRRPVPSTYTNLQASCEGIDNDWLANAIQVARVAAVAGEFAPFPYIKGAGLLFQAFLEPLQVR